MNALEQSINSVRVAATAADGMKAEDVVAYNVGDKLGICDLMMIASRFERTSGSGHCRGG